MYYYGYGGYGYNNPCSRVSDSADMSLIGNGVTPKQVGAWYNYYAASAGTISTNDNTTVTSSDICPSGWHLPTGPANDTSSDFYKIYQSTSSGYISINDYLTAFGPVTGGLIRDQMVQWPGEGFWWCNKTSYFLNYNVDRGRLFHYSAYSKYDGLSIRCVKTS